jgi:maleylpyruvate isomerase
MTDAVDAPLDDLARVVAVERRLAVTTASVDDRAMRSPSLLPGWTVGHLLTHLARNADSHLRRTAAAVAGEAADQYPGGAAQRSGEIEDGAGRSAAEILADVRDSSTRMLGAWEDVPPGAWGGVTRDFSGTERPLRELPGRRWIEVEVHLIDLGTGPTAADWSDDFIDARLPPMRAGLAGRLPDGAGPPAAGAFDARQELAWLYGRLHRPDMPDLGPWQ